MDNRATWRTLRGPPRKCAPRVRRFQIDPAVPHGYDGISRQP
jgi:hypothetical protein